MARDTIDPQIGKREKASVVRELSSVSEVTSSTNGVIYFANTGKLASYKDGIEIGGGSGSVATINRKPNILVIDFETSAQGTTSNVMRQCLSLASRLDCVVTRVSNATLPTHIVNQEWDGIIVPFITNATAAYTGLNTFLGNLVNKCPVAVVAAYISSINATITTVTGATAVAGAAAAGLAPITSPWANPVANMAWYAQAPTALDSTATLMATNGTDNYMWSKTLGGCQVLFIAGYLSSNSATATTNKVHLAYQWLKDRNPAIAYLAAELLIRWDGMDNTADSTGMQLAYTSGALDTIYTAAQGAGIKNIWECVQYSPGGYVGSTSPATVAWFNGKSVENGGLFMFTNHQTDLYNGVNDKCSSDNILTDLFAASQSYWLLDCANARNAGFVLGEDGNCKGVPVVIDGNDCNNPAATFLGNNPKISLSGGVGAYLWVIRTEQYPTNAPTITYLYNTFWNGCRTITAQSGDTFLGTTQDLATIQNAEIINEAIYGGTIYWHGANLRTVHAAQASLFFANWIAAPDVIKSSEWAVAKQQFDRDIAVQYVLG